MNEDQWRAPGHERADGGAPEQGRSVPGPPPAGPHPGTEPYATPSPTDPYAAPDPYATPSRQQPAHVAYAGAFATSDRHRERVLAGAGYDTPAYRNDRLAVTAMVLGIIGIPVPGVCLLAIAFGHLALHRLRTSYEGGRGLAVAGLSLGYAMTAIWLSLLGLLLLSRSLL